MRRLCQMPEEDEATARAVCLLLTTHGFDYGTTQREFKRQVLPFVAQYCAQSNYHGRFTLSTNGTIWIR